MSKELVIPTDQCGVRAFDPYSVQGMINALTFFAWDRGKDVVRDYNAYVVEMEDNMITLVPTKSGLATKHIKIDSMLKRTTMSMLSELSIFNPDKVEYKAGEAIKFYARDPAAILTIRPGPDGTIKTTLTVTDIRHPDRVHGASVLYGR